MLGRLLRGSIGFACCTLLFLSACAVDANTLSANHYLALRKSLGASHTSLAAVQNDLIAYIGKTVELTGHVGGSANSGGSGSFIINSNGEDMLVKVDGSFPDCIAEGNTVRILAKLGPECMASLSDLHLVGAAYDYDVSAREKELAPKARPVAATPRRVLDRSSNPKTFLSSKQGRGVNLSSRAMQVYDPYRRAIASFNPNLTNQQVESITKSILAYSEKYSVDPRLIIALIIAESGFRPNATSRCGAMGLCQLMPSTARGLGVSNAYDPQQNIEASIKLVRGHLDKFGNISLALSAYNAGPGAVRRHGGVPPYRETQNYIRKIAKIYKTLCGG